MAKIILTLTQTVPPPAFVAGIKEITGASLIILKSKISSSAPIFEQELFLNNHDEIALQIRSLRALAGQFGVKLRYYELQPEEDFSRCPKDQCELDPETVENILKEWEDRRGK